MGKPIKVTTHRKSLYQAQDEMHHASSSLCMPDYPLKNAPSDAFYMTDKYEYADHAQEHVFAASVNLNVARKHVNDVAFKLRMIGMNLDKRDEAGIRELCLKLSTKLEEML